MRMFLATLMLAALAVLPVSPATSAEAGLECPGGFDDTQHDPLLLVHGTFANARENWGWNWERALLAEGWDVCTITLPDRSLGDMQEQGELVADAIRTIASSSGGKVDVMGHSQGGLHPRWAVKWWPDVRNTVDDLIMLAAPNHGTALLAGDPPFGCFASCWQMKPGSKYLAALNAGDETPGDISYTSIYTLFDELVLPQVPESSSTLEDASNIAVQDVCPGRPVEHAGLMADLATYEIVMDALSNTGPADIDSIDPFKACAGATFADVGSIGEFPGIARDDFADGFPEWENVPTEPPLKDYTQPS